jgi:hypothetical protein
MVTEETSVTPFRRASQTAPRPDCCMGILDPPCSASKALSGPEHTLEECLRRPSLSEVNDNSEFDCRPQQQRSKQKIIRNG